MGMYAQSSKSKAVSCMLRRSSDRCGREESLAGVAGAERTLRMMRLLEARLFLDSVIIWHCLVWVGSYVLV